MRQRARFVAGPLRASEPQTGADAEAALASKSASVRKPRRGYARFLHTTPGSTASASPRGGRRDRAPLPAALASSSHRPRWGSAGGHAPAARPCLTAYAPAPMSPAAVGTPQYGVLTA